MDSATLFAPLLKETPNDATIISHKLMLKAGMIRQVAAGLYIWLPLGVKVLHKIERVIRKQLDASGAQEILMPCIQPVELWHRSGRIKADGDLKHETLMMKDRKGTELLFSPTAEEMIADLIHNNVQSYKDFPMNLYQIAWKFRDEIRPRFGVMRGREFLMKDAYSFHVDADCALVTYNKMMKAYVQIFLDLGLSSVPVKADSGSIGGDMSHEFHILAKSGESKIYYEEGLDSYLKGNDITLEGLSKFYAMEEEKHDLTAPEAKGKKIVEQPSIEVGHIFYLGDKYTKAMGVTVQDNAGKPMTPQMGCYGIGVSRLVAAIIEASHDERGIIWPREVAPYDVSIINLRPTDKVVSEACERIQKQLEAVDTEVLYDDSAESAGAKFASHDLIGIPIQIIIGPKSLEKGIMEVKERATGKVTEVGLDGDYTYGFPLARE